MTKYLKVKDRYYMRKDKHERQFWYWLLRQLDVSPMIAHRVKDWSDNHILKFLKSTKKIKEEKSSL